ncbi:DUF7344 domain-containing protein [Halegenticoccus tardaugens]|uniref:DUF7344 domain-containing protein n=1 Tax=Halegenticoccus tardaugens TaxID=2071624 RepID=UPI003743125F
MQRKSDRREVPSDVLSMDVIFELLKNRRRRDILRYLLSTERTVTLSELAEQIAAWENDIEVRELGSDQRKRVYVALYQTHLPKMDDAGIIDYDQDRGNITLSENADLLNMYLDTGTESDTEWEKRYIGLSLTGGTLALFLQFVGLGAVPEVGLAAVFASIFLLVSLFHAYDAHRTRQARRSKLSRIE